MPDSDDEYWRKIGTEHPYWGVLSHDRFRGKELPPDRKKEFFADGIRDMDFAITMIHRHIDPNFAPRRAIDFGCGVGRLTIAMGKIAQSVVGVDISEGMLSRAADEARRMGADGVRFSQTLPDEAFDWINSFIVFQHILPQTGFLLLDTLLARLASGGIISLHFSIFRDSRIALRGVSDSQYGRFDGKCFRVYELGSPAGMPIYEYDLSEIILHLVKYGIGNMTLCHTDHGGLHGVWIFAGRG